MNPNVLTFFKEFFQRLFIKSPVFFKVFQLVTGSFTFAAYIPAMLCRWFDVDVPQHFINLCEDMAKYSTGFFASTFLTAETKPVAIMNDGDILKKVDEVRLPFTKQCDDRDIRKKLMEVPKVAEVVEMKKDEASYTDPNEAKKLE